jgi:hypothetical protein
MTIVSDATTWSITYSHHCDDSRDVIDDCNIFINQATDYSAILVVVVTVDEVIFNNNTTSRLLLNYMSVISPLSSQ